MLDTFLDWGVVFLPTILSGLGVLVSIKAPHSKHHTMLRVSLVAFGIIVSVVTFWQQSRSRHAHAVEITALNNTLGSVRTDLKNFSSRADIEVARREQAEKDLMLGMVAVGKDTRAGIAQDLRKIPLKVEASGKSADTPERKRIREALGVFVQRGMAIRDQLGTTVPVNQIEGEGQAWFDEVQLYLQTNLDSSYVSQFRLTHTEPNPSDIPAEKLSLWHGLNERILTLDKFIDQLK